MIPLWSDEVEQRLREAAHSIDEQKRPTEVKFCTKCVVSNQRPRIVFDEDGVCSACRYKESMKEIDWLERRDMLSDLLKEHRTSAGYNVIVPCSGGKDSSTIAHKLKTEWGMSPICVTWAPFVYTDIGWKNFQSFVHSGFTVLNCFPDGLTHRKLSRLAFEYLGDAWQPFTYGQLYYAMHMSNQMDIPLVFWAENGESEYGGDPNAGQQVRWGYGDWERIYLKGAGVQRLVNTGRDLGCLTDETICPYYYPPEKISADFQWWAYYNDHHPQGSYYYASESTGFEANHERSEGTYSKYASLDDRFDGFHYYMAFIKFGIGRATSDASHEVRDDDITRDEAVALVRRFDGGFPKRYYREFLDYLGLDEAQFHCVVDRYRPEHLWQFDKGQWWLKHTVHGTEAIPQGYAA